MDGPSRATRRYAGLRVTTPVTTSRCVSERTVDDDDQRTLNVAGVVKAVALATDPLLDPTFHRVPPPFKGAAEPGDQGMRDRRT